MVAVAAGGLLASGTVGASDDTVPAEDAEGVIFLAEESVDHAHACGHGDEDPRTPLEAGDAVGEGPTLEETHDIWNVTYVGDEGYVSVDTDAHAYDGPFTFYVADGSAEPVDATVLESGEVEECDSLDNYLEVETPEDGTLEFELTADEADEDGSDEESDGGDETDDTDDTNETDESENKSGDSDDETHNLDIDAFELLDRETNDALADVHDDHWHGEVPDLQAGDSISLEAAVTDDGDELDLGDDYHLEAAFAAGATESVLSLESHGDHVTLSGDEAGETEVVFLVSDGEEAVYETPSLEVAVDAADDDESDGDDETDGDDEQSDELGTLEVVDRDTDAVVATWQDGEWDGEIPDLYGGEPLVLEATAEDDSGEEIELGDDHELGVSHAAGAEELLGFDERGDHVYVLAAGDGETEVVFELREDETVIDETASVAVESERPPGIKFLVETEIDNSHACFHGDYDSRTALDGGDEPGSGPVLEDDHVIWNVTAEGESGYVTFDTEPHWWDGPFVFYTADGTADPVDAEVVERGEVDECATLDSYVQVETPEDGLIDFELREDTEVPDDIAGEQTTVAHEFAGIVDDDPLPVSADGLTDGDGTALEGDVTVQVVREDTVLAETTGVTVEDGSIDGATVDTTAIDPAVEPGPATIAIDGVDTDHEATIDLVHEVRSLEDGFSLQGIPQPAALHTENVSALERWDTEAESYVSLGASYDDGEVIDAAGDLHRGLYVDADADARLGYDFQTDDAPAPGDVHLEDGWHLASANFALGEDEGTRTLGDDLVNIDPERDGITVFDAQQRTQLGAGSLISGYDAYWLYVDNPDRADRGTIGPNYEPTDRAAALNGAD
ncbi:hypothetical protein G6M89_11495 [Natronolimnobius sp. AArcel1]|nr:hypothetical protein [Natronolimnobius sp. AArcel1]